MIQVPRLISPIVQSGEKWREGKGFSIEELKDVELTPAQGRSLGIPVDIRRTSKYEENVDALKEYVAKAREAGVKFGKPKSEGKGQTGRAFRGLTSAGKKMRNLSHKK